MSHNFDCLNDFSPKYSGKPTQICCSSSDDADVCLMSEKSLLYPVMLLHWLTRQAYPIVIKLTEAAEQC